MLRCTSNLSFLALLFSFDALGLREPPTPFAPVPRPRPNNILISDLMFAWLRRSSFDIKHMPQGCATWPAAWETGESNWPNLGEVDIIEGVNDNAPNAATLHTSSGCTMPAQRSMTG
jgi:hypothetical protein